MEFKHITLLGVIEFWAELERILACSLVKASCLNLVALRLSCVNGEGVVERHGSIPVVFRRRL